MRRRFPNHPVWNHPVFQHKAYAAFAQDIDACLDAEAAPGRLTLLYQAIPLLADHLQALDARNEQRVKELKGSIDHLLELQGSQAQHLQILTSGNLVLRLEASQMPLQRALPAPLSSSAPSAAAAAEADIAPTPPARSRSLSPLPAALRAALEPAPKHRMCRAVRTVHDLWREWTVGLQGQPSITELDRRWGNQWRAGRQSELQWYSLRLEVIKEIRRIAQVQRTSEEAAMWQVSQHQQQLKCSLDQLCKRLRAARKEGI